MLLFAIATTIPVLLIALAVQFGGIWPFMSVAYITLFAYSLDRLIARQSLNPDPEAEFPAASSLLVFLGIAHLGLLGMSIWAVAGPSGLILLDRVLIAMAASLVFGQISHPVAHELIHKPGRALRLLGRAMYSSLLIGHHASAHLLIHHVHVGSHRDPNTARMGEGFYRFALRAARGSFSAALEAETRRLRSAGRSRLRHPFLFYGGVSLAMLAVSYALAGPVGILVFVAMAIYAQMQIYMSDYVQHYGLYRAEMADGKPEPVGPHHSWNAPQVFSSAMMVNAPRHSDHHVTPSRPYPALKLDAETMPYLPHSLPVMAALALMPPVWRYVMDPLCEAWQPGQRPTLPASARDIPQAVLDKAKSGGLMLPILPNSRHAPDLSDPLPAPVNTGSVGPKPAQRG